MVDEGRKRGEGVEVAMADKAWRLVEQLALEIEYYQWLLNGDWYCW